MGDAHAVNSSAVRLHGSVIGLFATCYSAIFEIIAGS